MEVSLLRNSHALHSNLKGIFSIFSTKLTSKQSFPPESLSGMQAALNLNAWRLLLMSLSFCSGFQQDLASLLFLSKKDLVLCRQFNSHRKYLLKSPFLMRKLLLSPNVLMVLHSYISFEKVKTLQIANCFRVPILLFRNSTPRLGCFFLVVEVFVVIPRRDQNGREISIIFSARRAVMMHFLATTFSRPIQTLMLRTSTQRITFGFPIALRIFG